MSLTPRPLRSLALATLVLLSLAAPAAAAGVHALFDTSSPGGGPFPSDLFTTPDPSHLTGLRVQLPTPTCPTVPPGVPLTTACDDIAVINTLDGFNLQPRLSIPFSDAIDPASVNSTAVFLISQGDAVTGAGAGKVIGINQVVWDPATNTLHVESDEFLDQHTRYALIVTNDIRDAGGDPVEAGDFATFRHDLNFGQTHDQAFHAYRKRLLTALGHAGVPPSRVVAASVFTTQSATAIVEKIRAQIKAGTPDPANFAIGVGGARTVFPRKQIGALAFVRQVGFDATGAPRFSTTLVPTSALDVVPGSIGTVAFGRYASPDYETAEKFIPPYGTRTGVPAVQFTNDVYFNLFLPAEIPGLRTKPAAGWPVAIFGHGFGDNKNNSPFVVASVLAARGVASIAINVVGHGGGSAGSLVVNPTTAGVTFPSPPVAFPAGGRGIDQDNNGTIDSTEGSSAAFPRGIIGNRDGLVQTVIDLMQLVRVIETGGVDVNGDGFSDLDPGRIYYFGQSFGGIYGTKFLAVEPSVRLGVPNVPGGPIIEIARLSPVFRPLVGLALHFRAPALDNVPPTIIPGPPAVTIFNFNEQIPLRNQPPLTASFPGATAIQEVIEWTEWVSQSGNSVAYAPHIRKAPLDGVPAKTVIVQFAKGDQTVPNPTATNLLRAGDLSDRTTYFRNDLVRLAFPTAPANPHTFLTNIAVPSVAPLAVAAQDQIARFFASDGEEVVDPDGAGPFFEVPIAGPLPEVLNFP